MKILYVGHKDPRDYLQELIFHGLYKLFGADVVDANKIWWMYEDYDPSKQSKDGSGACVAFQNKFSPLGSLKDIADRSNIEEKIKDRFYDFIVYGSCNKSIDFLEEVREAYPPDKIAFIDGSDNQIFHIHGEPEVDPSNLFFKRELCSLNRAFPVSFCIPEESIVKDTEDIEKEKLVAEVVPFRPETYVFQNEEEYFKDYQQSFFGVTTKKAGWDCYRHYEILANYCIPYFRGIENCPEHTLFSFPKKKIKESNKIWEGVLSGKNFNREQYKEHLEYLYKYTKENLTTTSMANYITEKIA